MAVKNALVRPALFPGMVSDTVSWNLHEILRKKQQDDI